MEPSESAWLPPRAWFTPRQGSEVFGSLENPETTRLGRPQDLGVLGQPGRGQVIADPPVPLLVSRIGRQTLQGLDRVVGEGAVGTTVELGVPAVFGIHAAGQEQIAAYSGKPPEERTGPLDSPRQLICRHPGLQG